MTFKEFMHYRNDSSWRQMMMEIEGRWNLHGPERVRNAERDRVYIKEENWVTKLPEMITFKAPKEGIFNAIMRCSPIFFDELRLDAYEDKEVPAPIQANAHERVLVLEYLRIDYPFSTGLLVGFDAPTQTLYFNDHGKL